MIQQQLPDYDNAKINCDSGLWMVGEWRCVECSTSRSGVEVEQLFMELWNRVEQMVAGVHSGSVEEMEAFIKEQEG